jgi:hypothetical protein
MVKVKKYCNLCRQERKHLDKCDICSHCQKRFNHKRGHRIVQLVRDYEGGGNFICSCGANKYWGWGSLFAKAFKDIPWTEKVK